MIIKDEITEENGQMSRDSATVCEYDNYVIPEQGEDTPENRSLRKQHMISFRKMAAAYRMKNDWKKTPAIVKYIGKNSDKFSTGQEYEAFFIEYWQGTRNSLHVRGNDGLVTDFNPLEDFEIIKDSDNLLNNYEAYIRCISNNLPGLTEGKVYKAIGRDSDGLYLVMDDSYDCYFYPPELFVIESDKHGILSRRSVYYSYRAKNDEVKKY